MLHHWAQAFILVSNCTVQTTMERLRVPLLLRIQWILITLLPVCGQIGVTICACQPSVYTFTFNFSATCEISTVEGPGVIDADCFARGFAIGSEDDVNDTVPVQVTTVSVMELNKDLGVLVQTPFTNVFRDGDNFTYTSILSTPDSVTGLTPDMIPGGIQLGIVGVNQFEEPITNVWIILFDNACGTFPVLEVGDQIGWTVLSDLKEPLQSVCPLAPPPLIPTVRPTTAPSITPTASTSEQPSTLPTSIPSFSPSAFPTPSCPPIRRNNDTSVMGQAPGSDANTLLQKQIKFHQGRHQFYTPLQYEPRGRGVGTSSPVLPPSECPEVEMIIPVTRVDVPSNDTNTEPKQMKKIKTNLEKKEKLPGPKDAGMGPKDVPIATPTSKMSKLGKRDKHKGNDDDELLFVEIKKSLTPSTYPSDVPVQSNDSDDSLGTPPSAIPIPPTPAPTTKRSEMEGRNDNGTIHHVPVKAKQKLGKQKRMRR